MNPILQALNMRQNPIDAINQLKRLAGGDPNAAYQMLMQRDPRFREFVNANQGKSAEQIARENGIDMSALNELIRPEGLRK